MNCFPRILINRHVCSAFAAMTIATGLGCGDQGPNLVPVRGKVLLDGQPLKFGSVMTQPKAGRGANGTIQSDGSFELNSGREPGALVGTHQVAVVAYENVGSSSPEAGHGKLLTPQRYSNAESSGLTIEVTSGENNPIIELISK